MKPRLRLAIALAASLGASATCLAQSPADFFNPVGSGYRSTYRSYYHRGYTPRPVASQSPWYVGPQQHNDANVAYSSAYYRGPGGEVVRSDQLPPNSSQLGYRYAGHFSAVRPYRGK